MDARAILIAGQKILEPILTPRGFVFQETAFDKSSGGDFASGKYARGERALELHFRHSLGLVTYHIGKLAITHEEYIRCVLGTHGGNRYPGFSDDPLDAFRDLSSDLRTYCMDFLAGPGEDFASYARIAEERQKRDAFARMTEFES